jgi:DNA-binding response OmpR family regulator
LKTILVVEDEELLREVVCDILRSNNFNVLEAANGMEAQLVLTSSAIDLIICDMKMPQMDGFELLQWVRKGSYTPFILMTGVPESLEARAVFEMAIDDFIIKPFSRKDLISAIDGVLRDNSLKEDTSL